MLQQQIPLHALKVGKSGVVTGLLAEGIRRRRLLDLGFVAGAVIKCERKSPLGDPTAYRVRGAVIALRSEEARTIIVREIGREGIGNGAETARLPTGCPAKKGCKKQ
ncbi:MAG: ferrous iron transport protein A [Firmicutes bacterium]|nr:ferrous iron transport protein A [Bacillota bacterium]